MEPFLEDAHMGEEVALPGAGLLLVWCTSLPCHCQTHHYFMGGRQAWTTPSLPRLPHLQRGKNYSAELLEERY